jgi:transposase InsO family protein
VDIHQNAALTPKRREAMVRLVLERGASVKTAASAFTVSERTVRKWLARFRELGQASLHDRSSRPRRSPRRTALVIEEEIERLRRQRLTCRQIAQQTGISCATVQRILMRRGLNRLRNLQPPEPVRRYEHPDPGALLHLDIKKLARIDGVGHRITGDRSRHACGVGWEFVHVAIDDHSRLAFSRILEDERDSSAVAFLIAALDYFGALDIRVRGLLTDNGGCYRSHAFRDVCRRFGIRHYFTRPYRPCTNGKAERFIQTSLREWAYARAYQSSAERADHLPRWLHAYNWHRPHGSLNFQPPISRLGFDRNNLLRHHS